MTDKKEEKNVIRITGCSMEFINDCYINHIAILDIGRISYEASSNNGLSKIKILDYNMELRADYMIGDLEISYSGAIGNKTLVDIISLALDYDLEHQKSQKDISDKYLNDIKIIKNMFYNRYKIEAMNG